MAKAIEYTEGPKAHENFEAAMKAVFKVGKSVKRGKKKGYTFCFSA
jgi:hypothetical protein